MVHICFIRLSVSNDFLDGTAHSRDMITVNSSRRN